jgi:hypothetical protein
MMRAGVIGILENNREKEKDLVAPAGTPVPTRIAKSSPSHPCGLFDDLSQCNPIST